MLSFRGIGAESFGFDGELWDSNGASGTRAGLEGFMIVVRNDEGGVVDEGGVKGVGLIEVEA